MNRRYGFGMRRAAVRKPGNGSAPPASPPFYAFTSPGALPPGASLMRASAGCHYDAAGLLASAAPDAPRFDHDPGTLTYLGLLIEPSATNVIAASSAPNDSAWTVLRFTKSTPLQTDPAGDTTALLVTGDGANGARNISATCAIPMVSGTSYMLSAFVKAGTQSLIQLTGTASVFGSAGYANFQLTGAGTIGTATVPATIQALPGGWYRLSIVQTATADVAAGAGAVALIPITSLSAARAPSTAISTTLLVWGGGAVPGSSPGSYIATTSAAATRAEDTLTLDGPSGNWRVTFDDGGTQTLALTASAGKITIAAAALNRPWVKSVEYLP